MKIMENQDCMALATSVEDLPNVRIVNFYYDEKSRKIYFASFKENDKVKEMDLNQKVSFTTIPKGGTAHIKARGQARQSEESIYDLEEAFVNKIPDYKEIIKFAGPQLLLFELDFESAMVIMDMDNIYHYVHE
jgi:uncharacterized pyridoxamine 5'-phosphate oxidase family protein